MTIGTGLGNARFPNRTDEEPRGSAPPETEPAADVEGYSRHMERDEAATLGPALLAHRVIVDELVNSHNGRITGTAGDSVPAESPALSKPSTAR